AGEPPDRCTAPRTVARDPCHHEGAVSERCRYSGTTRTAPRAALVVSAAYAFNAIVTLRARFLAGFQASTPRASMASRRWASVASSTTRLIEREGMSILIRSPSSTRPINPPSAASGERCPIDRPDEPPEKRPSVTSAQTFPRPFDLR